VIGWAECGAQSWSCTAAAGVSASAASGLLIEGCRSSHQVEQMTAFLTARNGLGCPRLFCYFMVTKSHRQTRTGHKGERKEGVCICKGEKHARFYQQRCP